MNIQVIGCGMVGSTIAFSLLKDIEPNKLHLVDINKKRVKGEWMDLERVKSLLGLHTKITFSSTPKPDFDYHILSLGARRDFTTCKSEEIANDEAFHQNWMPCFNVVKKIKKGKIIVVTHPVETIVSNLRTSFPFLDFVPAGHRIDKINDGKKIMKFKGYTNWGIAIEVVLMIKKGGETTIPKRCCATCHYLTDENFCPVVNNVIPILLLHKKFCPRWTPKVEKWVKTI